MYKIAICDDDKKYIDKLKRLIIETHAADTNLLQFYEFQSGEQLLFYPNLDFDVIFMDMQMGKMDGYETAMELRKQDDNFLLVFCSGVVMPLPKFFKAKAFRYLDKNDSDEEMRKELTAILVEVAERNVSPFIMCKHNLGNEQIRVYAENILYIAIRHLDSQIFPYGKIKETYQNAILRSPLSLNSVANIFDESCGFVRIHNSYIVNMAYIRDISPTAVRLIDNTELSIARSKLKNFQQVFAKFMASKYEG